jgi:AraC-like DNA-binding protein
MNEIITHGRLFCPEIALHKNLGMEITYIEEGNLEWITDGTPEEVKRGSIYFTLPWQTHGSIHPREPDNKLCFVLFELEEEYKTPQSQFRFPESLGFTTQEMLAMSKVFAKSEQHCFPATPKMENLITMLIDELSSDHMLKDALCRSLLRAVLIELKRMITGTSVITGTHNRAEQRVKSLIQDIQKNCGELWTLERMSEHCDIQRTQLNSLFQKMTGCTPIEYLNQIRIDHAKAMLRDTSIKITDISAACGFNSSQYFANTFKQATGSTPSQYRKLRKSLENNQLWRRETLPFRSKEEEIAHFNYLTKHTEVTS